MSKQTVSNEYVSAFCLEMSLLLHAGIGIEDGLYLLIEDETDKKSKKMLEQLADLVTEGKPFSEAVREVGTFPKYVGDMIETGEETGRLEQSFQALADYYDRQQQLMSQIRSPLLNPIILMILILSRCCRFSIRSMSSLAVRWAARRSFYCGLATGSEVSCRCCAVSYLSLF